MKTISENRAKNIALRIYTIERSLDSVKKHLELQQYNYAVDNLYSIISASQCIINLIKLSIVKESKTYKLSHILHTKQRCEN